MQEVSLKNILADQKVAAAFVKQVLKQANVINNFDIKTLFDPKNRLSKLPRDVKMNILKKKMDSLYVFGDFNNPYNDIKFQRCNFDQIIKNLPEEYRLELDIHITDILCERFVKILADGDEIADAFKNSLPYLDSQLKLAEEQNWPAEKKAVIQKWIAYCNEKINPELKRTKNVFLDLVSLLLTEGKGEFSITKDMPSIQKLAIFNGVLKSYFKDKSIIINDDKGGFLFNSFHTNCLPEDEAKLTTIDKIDFREVLKTKQRLSELCEGNGYFKATPLTIRVKIATTTPILKTFAQWCSFTSPTESGKINSEMDAALLSSLPKEEFNYNLYDVLDCIIGEREIKIQEPLQSEQSYDDEEESSLDTEANTEDEITDEADIVHESYKKQNSVYQLSPALVKKLEKEEEQEQPNWFIKFILCIAKIFGIKTAFGYYTNTYKKIASATPAHIGTSVYTKPKSYSKPKNVKQSKNEIPKTMVPGQKNISL